MTASAALGADSSTAAWAGSLTAVAASFLWAITSLLFGAASRRVGALPVNQLRLMVAALALLALHRLVLGAWWPTTSGRTLAWLAASGIAGLALGDSLYFHACAVLGPRSGTLLMATAPVQTVPLAWLLLDERLRPAQLGAIALTLLGIGLVLHGGGDQRWTPPPRRSRRAAWLAGLAAGLCQAAGYVLSRQALLGARAEGAPLEPLSATLVRLVLALPAAVALAVLTTRGSAGLVGRALCDRHAVQLCALGAVLGPALGVWCSMHALSVTATGVAATLLSLTPLMMVPIARHAYGSRTSPVELAGTFLAVAGSALLCSRRG